MSVLARLRSASKLDVLDLAEEIRAEATRLVWNTNIVPKDGGIYLQSQCVRCATSSILRSGQLTEYGAQRRN